MFPDTGEAFVARFIPHEGLKEQKDGKGKGGKAGESRSWKQPGEIPVEEQVAKLSLRTP